ncbi:thiamine-phosphate kinase [Leptolyngbya sp. AN02str]|uniref:thiamine-phosphate kinase n=1 Tax=Leptolyngbya sp. AN02str TaxID=3423363 RepID=UPI003D3150F3
MSAAETAHNSPNPKPSEQDLRRVREVGEQGVLERLMRFCPADVIGDDAALLTISPGRSLVVSEDVLVDGVHFSVGLALPDTKTTSPADVGWRAAAANLSDLAAMGAVPLGITVGLSLPPDMPIAWVDELYTGMVECLQQFGASIVGGDVCRSPTLTVAIAVFGEVIPTQAIRRAGATLGDVVWVSGSHGASRAGLELLLHPEQGHELLAEERAALIQAHQRPVPRLDVVEVIRLLGLDSAAIAGMDSSDGLADAVLQLCRASRVGAVLERSHIPLPNGLAAWRSPQQAMEWALYGGEDFELVLCLSRDRAEVLQQAIPGSAIVGTIVEGDTVVLHDSTSESADEVLSLSRGFQHF